MSATASPLVTSGTVTHLRVPFGEPIADSTHRIEVMDVVALELCDADGATGFAYALGFDYATDVLVAMIVDAAGHALRTSPAELAMTWQRGWDRYEYVGRSGIAAWGLAAVDIALWDLHGKQVGQPIWSLVGGAQRSVPIYGSGGWLSYSEAQLIDEATAYLADGYGGYKMKVGRDVDDDVRRVRRVRAELGDGVPLMIDANQGYGLADAQRLAAEVRDVGITWFEEPLSIACVDDYRRLRGSCKLPVAAGERAYYPQGIAEFLDVGALDIVMPDILRIGGVGKWLDVAKLAAAHGAQVAPHFYREFDVALAAAVPNASFVEGFRWTDDILDWSASIAGGSITPSADAGFGVRLRDDARARYTRAVHPVSAPG